MLKHTAKIISIVALITLCMFLPFLPGRYDSLAVTLSFMAQIFSWISLPLVPLGLIWLWFEISHHNAPNGSSSPKTKGFAFATLLALGFITVGVSLGALTNYNFAFGIFFLGLCFYLLIRAGLKLKNESSSDGLKLDPVPLYLIAVPIIAALVKFSLIPTAVQFSREYAVKNSEPLISAIETYHAKHGTYPASLQAIHTDILPGVIGIKQYHYEPSGSAYNLYFRQFSDELDVEEIVMYNKLDEHAFAAHVLDVLEYSGEALALRRGDRHKYKLSTPHWIYIQFE